MVTILREKVVCCAREVLRSLANYGIDLRLRGESKSVEDLAFKCATGRFRLWLRPVYARDATPVMTPIGIFSVIDDDSRMQKRGPQEPKCR